MMNSENVINKTGVTTADATKKMRIRGQIVYLQVFKVPIQYLFYNDQNGRIATEISKYQHDYGKMPKKEAPEYNKILEKAIISSNEPAYKKTKKNIGNFGQLEPGVIFPDGRIIDGNRRFTCLRKLYEETTNAEFSYFETVVLEENLSKKEIKLMELELQHGREEKIDYNPIDKLVDIYRDIVQDQIIDVKEYARSIDAKVNEVEKKVELAELMVDFLKYINAENQFYIARDLGIDGPLNEILNIKKKLKSDEDKWDKVRVVLYDNLILRVEGDITRCIRNIIKDIVLSEDRFDDFYNKHEEYAKELMRTLGKKEVVDIEFIRKDVREGLQELREEVKKNNDSALHSAKIEKVRNQPVDILSAVSIDIAKIDIEGVKRSKSKKRIIEEINLIREKLSEIEDVLNEVE